MRSNPPIGGRSVAAWLKSGAIKINQAQVSHRDLENPGITGGYANRDFGRSPPQMWVKARRNKSRPKTQKETHAERERERERGRKSESEGKQGRW